MSIIDKQQYQDKMYEDFEKELWQLAMAALDRHSINRTEKHQACAQLGKAMLVLGSNLLGNAIMEPGPTESLEKVKELLAWFKQRAEQRRLSL